jgi:valyl-tRNA synthetase
LNNQAACLLLLSQVLETGHDILFFWVARMIMMGIGLTGQVRLGCGLRHSFYYMILITAVHNLQHSPLQQDDER